MPIAALDIIDTRAFTSLWFWLALAAVWTLSSLRVLGVPADMIDRAARAGADVASAVDDVETLTRIAVQRRLGIAGALGLWLTALGAMAASAMAVLGFGYGVEWAQALLLLCGPVGLVWWLGVGTARDIASLELTGMALLRRLRRHRRASQAIGAASVFVTALWGMYRTLAAGMLVG